MNFALKSTDFFESHLKSGTYYVRIVDAKFALPKSGDDSSKDFVCLDIPQYPGEHDDITIGFDVEAGMFCTSISFLHMTDVVLNSVLFATERDRFGAVLPASVNTVSRMVSLRR